MKLNLGSYTHHKAGFESVDCRALPGVDHVVDLNQMPWPWTTDSIDEVWTSHCLEHLSDPLAAIHEIRRILKPGAPFTIIVPNAAGYMGVAAGHRSFLSHQFLSDVLGNAEHQNDGGALFSQARVTLHVFHWRMPLGWFTRQLVTAWERFWNRSFGWQLLWQVLGVVVPGEVWMEGRK
jgi:SAM-dependent methyltransferase